MTASITAVVTLVSTNARAQFACVGTLGASDVTCSNTGATAVPFLQDQLGSFNLTTTSSGFSNGITTTSVDGNVTATNSGINADMLETSASGLGNATSNNSGTIGTYISTLTGAGNATSTNSGTVIQDITTIAQDGGNALINNSGFTSAITTSTVPGSALVSGSATSINSGFVANVISTTADGGGNATTRNSGIAINGMATVTSNGGLGSGAGTATGINSGTVDTILTQTSDGGNAITINSGRIVNAGFGPGIFSGAVDGGNATTVNTGFVNGGIFTGSGMAGGDGNAITVNYGTVMGPVVTAAGVAGGNGNASALNAGKIYGTVDVIAGVIGSASFTNAGLVDGTSSGGLAINLVQFDPATPTTLNILPGSRIVGQVILNGDITDPFAVGTKVNILSGHDISSVLTFGGPGCGCGAFGGLMDTGAIVNITGGAPYVINEDTVAILDPTSFAAADRNVVDVTRTITSLVTSRLTNPAPIGGSGSMAIGFAPSGNVARDMANDAFSGIPALAYASNDRVLLSNPSFTAADGTSIWAQGFGGQRIQQADAPTLRSVSNFYGGVLGIDKTVQPGLRLGGFIGGGAIKSTIDLNSGDTSSDIGFGGLYGRYAMGRAFLDFSLLGGYSSNDVKRTIANNLVPGGYEYAAGKYNGWFISPEVAYGFQRSLGYNLTLTPSARMRYLAAGFGGYQEVGSSTNLTVASRTSHNFEERGEFKLTHTTNATPTEQLQLSGTAGLIALQRVGDSNVNTVLLGQSLAFATPGKASIVGFYAGAGFDWRNASGFSVFGAAEFTAMSDQSQTITGRGGVKVSF
ncbi:autotransporter outer membrane beta-barrel domain-containing protein [Afipia massiliensis]|uniref:Autotransporter outer membrane beta-barrel domain-containing protein n=1 Tax=Afipia massiliensis TaxID=211460 RepID=A0A4U6BRB3_9BRAD|nr:autotransporter outer membrane beta-barrel domain-containing protein [Afipia massiliensis]TKT73120.1 autotransporter outer membrane beta-barrel domain-containing protein [Afipia massiliensis]